MLQNILFVGEKRSKLAVKMHVKWEDGALAAKQLFDALREVGVNPLACRYTNWWEPGTRRLVRREAKAGVLIIALGRKVERELQRRHIPHRFMVHPAARGTIRRKANYADHVRSVMCTQALGTSPDVSLSDIPDPT